jgi:hypothetical protein
MLSLENLQCNAQNVHAETTMVTDTDFRSELGKQIVKQTQRITVISNIWEFGGGRGKIDPPGLIFDISCEGQPFLTRISTPLTPSQQLQPCIWSVILS